MRSCLRASLALAAALSTGAAAAVPAADQTVRATSGDTFSPASVTVAAGETVTWVNDGGFHNVRFDDGSFEQPSEPASSWPASVARTFPAAGTFRYYCEAHGAAGGVGMSGTVVVTAAASPTPAPTATAGPYAVPPAAPPPVSVGQPPATRFTVRVLRSRACNRRGRRCRRPGVLLRISADRVSVLRGVLRRRPLRGGRERPAGSVEIAVRKGAQTIRLRRSRGGRLLGPGRYRLTLRPVDGIVTRSVRFTIVKS